jgi:hypothetical protein
MCGGFIWIFHPRQAALCHTDISKAEHARKERYQLPHHQYQFISTRGNLRNLVNHYYVGIPAATLRLENNFQGSEYMAWLKEVGFIDVRRIPIHSPGGNGLLIGRKPEDG